MKVILVFCCLWWGMNGQVLGQLSEEFNGQLPLLLAGKGENRLAVYGYRGSRLDNGATRGEIQEDSSVFLSGFIVKHQEELLFEDSEYQIYRLKINQDSLYADLMMNMPVGKNRSWQYVPVIRYVIYSAEGQGKVSKPRKVLNMEKLSRADFVKIEKDLGWNHREAEVMFPQNQAYPEYRITNAFLYCMKYFPNYNTEFFKLNRGDGALAETFNVYAEILKALE